MTPATSVVMVTYGGFEVAKDAIDALYRHTASFELIVVDNASPDGTGKRLESEFPGIEVILNGENLGFAEGSNVGARTAHGEFLCLLNSDAIVEEGWLPTLVEALGDPTVGAVVPMFLNPDGTIQEAGSVVDSLGWAEAVGGRENSESFEHRFRREVDFGSAACMLLRRKDFLESGGLDPVFGVGYYEDADLCFRLKDRGLRTWYEPRSRVVHRRHGSTRPERAAELMRTNRAIFYSRWRDRLAGRPLVSDVSARRRRLLTARDAEALNRILVIDDRVPHTDRGSGDPRMAKLLQELVQLCPSGRVTLFAGDPRNAERYAPPLLEQGIEVACADGTGSRWFDERLFHYSVVIVSRPQNIERFDEELLRTQPRAFRVYDAEALVSRRLELAAAIARTGEEGTRLLDEAARWRRLESRAIASSDAVFCVTEEEREIIEQIAPEKPAFLLPTYVAQPGTPAAFDERRDLIFFGGFLGGAGSPNADAVIHLVDEVLPLIKAQLGDVTLRIVGADPPPAVRALHGNGIDVVGFVDDPAEWLARARVHVNPLRFGAGIKLKLLDTMAAGLPFVTTRVGGEGLGLGKLEASLVADEPAEIATRVVRLYEDRAAWEYAATGLSEIARARFSRPAFRDALVEAMAEFGIMPPAAGRL